MGGGGGVGFHRSNKKVLNLKKRKGTHSNHNKLLKGGRVRLQ